MSAPKKRLSWAEKTGVCVAVCLLTGFVVVIVIPNLLRAGLSKASNACITNLRQIEGAKQAWALENKKQSNDIPTSAEIALYVNNNKLPLCPQGGSYTLGRMDKDPKCSISTSAWPNDHVLAGTNNWWINFTGAYRTLFGRRLPSVSP